jgi:hypothetical protein
MGPSGLPLTDLNEFPTTINPAKQADEWMQRAMSMLSPAIKTPVELWSNFSFFFRDQIQRDTGPLVPFSALYAKAIPKQIRDQLGIVDDYVDKRTGRKGWAAPGKVVYAMGVLPGPANFLNRLTTPSERAGESGNKVLGYLGIRVKPSDAPTTGINQLYDQREKIDQARYALNQRGVYAVNATRHTGASSTNAS